MHNLHFCKALFVPTKLIFEMYDAVRDYISKARAFFDHDAKCICSINSSRQI